MERAYRGNEPSFYKFTYLVKEKLQAALYAARQEYNKAVLHYANVLRENKLNEGIFREVYLVLQRRGPLQVLDFLNLFYDFHNQEDLSFLIYNIEPYAKNKVLAYYIHAGKK